MNDDFLRMFILKFIFCCTALRHHRQFKSNPASLPASVPELPSAVYEHPQTIAGLSHIVKLLGATEQFDFAE